MEELGIYLVVDWGGSSRTQGRIGAAPSTALHGRSSDSSTENTGLEMTDLVQLFTYSEA